MVNNARITVLLPVYNGGKYLKEAIDSILNQTFHDFDLLVINDGSTDQSESIIKSYDDSRITYIKNKDNIGLVRTLNKGINMIDTEYIARMDQDDISLPTRLKKQLNYMDYNPQIAISGTSIKFLSENGLVTKHKVLTDTRKIKSQLFFSIPLMHPTVIMRTAMIKKNNLYYNENHKSVEDLGLWQKASIKLEFGNISEILLNYRINEEGMTITAEKEIAKRDSSHITVYKDMFDMLGIEYSVEDLINYRLFLTGRADLKPETLLSVSNIFYRISLIASREDYSLMYFKKRVASYLRYNCLQNGVTILEANRIYKQWFREVASFGILDNMKLLIRKYQMGR